MISMQFHIADSAKIFLIREVKDEWLDWQLILETTRDGEIIHEPNVEKLFKTHKRVLLRLYNDEADTYIAHFPMRIKLKKTVGNEISINHLEDLLRLARREFARHNIDTQMKLF